MLKLLDAGIIYPISDSVWVSPVQVVPKKGGITAIKNDNDELTPPRTVKGWRICINYKRLRLFPGKLRSRWSGPFVVIQVFPYRAVEVYHEKKGTFKVNGQRLRVRLDTAEN